MYGWGESDWRKLQEKQVSSPCQPEAATLAELATERASSGGNGLLNDTKKGLAGLLAFPRRLLPLFSTALGVRLTLFRGKKPKQKGIRT